jgi:hypothetical protein
MSVQNFGLTTFFPCRVRAVELNADAMPGTRSRAGHCRVVVEKTWAPHAGRSIYRPSAVSSGPGRS